MSTPGERTFGRWHTAGERRPGGQSTVFRVVGPRGEAAALKLAKEGADARESLHAEREQLAAIVARDADAARWVALPLDRGEEADGRPWVVLPWFAHSLRSWVHEKNPSLRERLEALRLAVEAVCRLHDSGPTRGQPRLHLDVKPDNFLVGDADGRLVVVLADLGAARSRSLVGAGELTAAFTPRYAPPEVVLGLQLPPDPGVDGYALAVVIYETLTGVEPRSVCAPWPLTALGRELVAGAADAEGAARLAELRAQPLGELVSFDEMEPLTPRDVARLRNSLADLLAAAGVGEGLVEALLAPLLGALTGALEPDPARRNGDPRKLAAALEAALERGGGPVAAPVAVAPIAVAPVAVAPDVVAPAAVAPAAVAPAAVAPAAVAPAAVTPTETDEFVGALRGDPLAAWLIGAVAVGLVAVVGWLWVRGGG